MENFSGSRCSSLIPGSWHALEKLTSREPPGREIGLPFGWERNIRSKVRSNTLTTFWDFIVSAIDNSIPSARSWNRSIPLQVLCQPANYSNSSQGWWHLPLSPPFSSNPPSSLIHPQAERRLQLLIETVILMRLIPRVLIELLAFFFPL